MEKSKQKQFVLCGVLLYLLLDVCREWIGVGTTLFKSVTGMDTKVITAILLAIYVGGIIYFFFDQAYRNLISKYVFIVIPFILLVGIGAKTLLGGILDIYLTPEEMIFYYKIILYGVCPVLTVYFIVLYFISKGISAKENLPEKGKQKELMLYGILLYLLVGAVHKWVEVAGFALVSTFDLPILIIPFLYIAYYTMVFLYFSGNIALDFAVPKYLFLIIPFFYIGGEYVKQMFPLTLQSTEHLYISLPMSVLSLAFMIYLIILYYRSFRINTVV